MVATAFKGNGHGVGLCSGRSRCFATQGTKWLGDHQDESVVIGQVRVHMIVIIN